MIRSNIVGIGKYLPQRVVTNKDLMQVMDTSDEWIRERTGVAERRYASPGKDSTASMGAEAARIAMDRAKLHAQDIDLVVFATLSPDYYFPGNGVLLQRMLGMKEVGALDIRNQCSGFIYGLSVADQFIKTGMYQNVLVVGSEIHSYALDFSTRGRNVSVIFGDGAGAVVLGATTQEQKGILSTHLHSDGRDAELLSMINPGFHAGHYDLADAPASESPNGFGGRFITRALLETEKFFPAMDGQAVFKKAVVKMPEVIQEALSQNGLKPADIDMLVPHQANLRISQYVQKKLGLREDQVFNNIQRYGNTTAASIPIALCEAWENGKIKTGDLVCLVAFGSGFTWASALIRW